MTGTETQRAGSASRLARLGVRQSERSLVLWLSLTFAVIQSTHAFGANAADALFFSRFGVEELPSMIVWSGFAVMVVVIGHAIGLASAGSRQWLWLVTAVGATLVLAERALIPLELAAIYPVIWISTQALIILTYTVMWNAAGSACTTTQAKRLFPLFASAGVAGAIVGNLATGPLATWMGTENLLLIQGSILGAGAFLLRRIRELFREDEDQSGPIVRQFSDAMGAVRASQLLRLTAVAGFALSVLAFLVVFPFNEAVADAFDSEAEIASFLGVFSTVATAGTFLVSLLATNRLFSRFGLVVSLMLVPIVYIAGFTTWLVGFGLATAAVVRLLQWVAVNAVQGTAYPALFNVLSGRRRGQVLAFVTAVPIQLGTVTAGLILVAGSNLSRNAQFGMAMLVAVAALLAVVAMRPAYIAAVVAAVRRGLVGVFDTPQAGLITPVDGDLRRALVGGLDDDRPEARAVALSTLTRVGGEEASTRAKPLLDDSSPMVRAAAFDTMCVVEPQGIDSHVARALDDESAEVRLRAVRYVSAFGSPANLETIRSALDDQDPRIRASAAAALGGVEGEKVLADVLGDDDPLIVASALHELAQSSLDTEVDRFLAHDHPKVRAAAVRVYATRPGSLGIITRQLDDSSPSVRTTAAQELAGTPEGREALLQVLETGSVSASEAALSALTPVDRFVPEFTTWARREAERAAMLWEQGQAISSGPDTPAAAALVETLSLRSQRLMGWVIMAMTTTETAAIMPIVERGVRSADDEIRSQAVEALETAGARTVMSVLTPLLDPDARHDLPDSRDALYRLAGDPDRWLRALAIRSLTEAAVDDLGQLRQLAANDSSVLVREAGPNVDHVTARPSDTLSIMDKVLALQRVPMFSGLDPEDLELLAGSVTEVHFEGDVRIYSDGEEGDEMLVVIAGSAVVTKETGNARQTLTVVESGEHVGELALLSSERRIADVDAGDGGLRGLVITKADLISTLEERPGVALEMLRTLSVRLAETTSHLSHVSAFHY